MAVTPRPSPAVWLCLSAGLVAIDQATKQLLEVSIPHNSRVPVLPGFDLTLRYNTGAAFSILAGQPGWQLWVFTLLAIGASTVIIYLLLREPERCRASGALTLILGGAIGNCIDRVLRGHVVDFLLLYWRQHHWPAFNVADAAISCGVILYGLDACLREHDKLG